MLRIPLTPFATMPDVTYKHALMSQDEYFSLCFAEILKESDGRQELQKTIDDLRDDQIGK